MAFHPLLFLAALALVLPLAPATAGEPPAADAAVLVATAGEPPAPGTAVVVATAGEPPAPGTAVVVATAGEPPAPGTAVVVATAGEPPAPGTAVLAAAAGDATAPVPASEDVAPFPLTTEPLPPAFERRVASALQRLYALRGWAPTGPIDIALQDRAGLRETLETLMTTEVSPIQVAAEERLLRTLDLLPPEVDYMEMVLGLLESEVAGYYDHREGALRLLDDMAGAEAELVLIHELWHALQDQHVGIGALRDPFERISDPSFARAALLEGDATAIMSVALRDAPLSRAEARVMGSMMRMLDAVPGMEADALPDVPEVMWQQLLFPYTHGAAFVLHLYLEGGWPLVDRSYLRAPRTTREILVPADWLAGWEPTWLELPPLQHAHLHDPAADDALGMGLCEAFSNVPDAAAPHAPTPDASFPAADAGEAPLSPAASHAPSLDASIRSEGGAEAPGMGGVPPHVRDPVRYLSDVIGMFTLSEVLHDRSGGALSRAAAQRASAALAGDRLDAYALDAERDLIVWMQVWDSATAAERWMAAALNLRFGGPDAGLVTDSAAAALREERAWGEGARVVFGEGDHLLLLERWGDLTLLILDRGGLVAGAARCETVVRAAGHVLRGAERSSWPAALEGRVEVSGLAPAP